MMGSVGERMKEEIMTPFKWVFKHKFLRNRQFLNACFCQPDYRRLDLTHGGTVARFAPGLQRLEKYAPPILPLA
jgi:hypothetical protein